MRLSVAVGIATSGRPALAAACICDLARQSRPPDRILVSLAAEEDLDRAAVAGLGLRLDVLQGPRGSTHQRNTILDALDRENLVLFLDDDFLMAPDFLAELERLFVSRPQVSVATGEVLADGILGPGLSFEEGRRLLDAAPAGRDAILPVRNAYGCNMAFRLAPIRTHGLRFDENLPLYGWLEDVDFSHKIAAHGLSVKTMRLRGVHLGVKRGRTSGLRFGYSQIANPLYLNRRGTMGRRDALQSLSRNVLANLAKSLRPEAWVDRRGRLRGNALAFADLLRGRLDPRRILTLEGPDGRRA